MVLTSKKTNFKIEDTKLYKSLKQLQKELQSRSDSEWFDWIYSRMEFDKNSGSFFRAVSYSYNDLLDFSFVVNNLESSVELILKENCGVIEDNLNNSLLTKMVDRETLPIVDSDTIFSKGLVFYNVKGHYISTLAEKKNVIYNGKKIKLRKGFLLNSAYELQNLVEETNSLRKISYNKDSYIISKTIFPDELFDNLFMVLASDLEINLNPSKVYLEKVKDSFVEYENITSFEKLCWLSCELKNNLLSDDNSDKQELLKNFNMEADQLLNDPLLKDKNLKDSSDYFLSFLLKNYCNIIEIDSYGKKVGTKMFSHILNGPVGSGHFCVFAMENLLKSKNEEDLLSVIEQKQIFLKHLKLYEAEFSSVLNRYHLKFLQWMIKEYERGTIPSISISITVKTGKTVSFISGFTYKLVKIIPPLTWLLKSNSRFLYSYISELNNIKFNSRATSGRAPRGVFFR